MKRLPHHSRDRIPTPASGERTCGHDLRPRHAAPRGLHAQHAHEPTKRSADFIACLDQLDRLYGRKPGRPQKWVVPVEASGRTQVCKIARRALEARRHWLAVERLRKCTPEVNQIEVVWHDLKAHPPVHGAFADTGALDRAIRTGVAAQD